MRMKIEGAEERANTSQCIADSAEQRVNNAQYAADAAEQHAVAAQSDADVVKAKQEQLEQELQHADLAFQEERKICTTEIAAAQHMIGALLLREARTKWIYRYLLRFSTVDAVRRIRQERLYTYGGSSQSKESHVDVGSDRE